MTYLILFSAMTARKPKTPRFASPARKGLKPEWAALPKRHCDNCGTKYKPVRPLAEGQRGFCQDNCRKEYHKHSGAYRKLRDEMKKMLARELPALVSAGVAAELKRQRDEPVVVAVQR